MYSPQQVEVKTRNSYLSKVLSTSKLILMEYDLCEHCTGRLFTKKLGLSQHKILGKKIQNSLGIKRSKKCYICKNLLPNLGKYLEMMYKASFDYEFSTFLVGAILKPSMVDNDDTIRSKYKLKGIDSVKTAITHQLSKKFSRKIKKDIDYLRPDLTFTINFKNDTCKLSAKPLYFQGRYTKKIRGIPQKQVPCHNCKGKGCSYCGYHGILKSDSVEGVIAEFLFKKFGANQAKITWIGGEDKSSLVLGKGRPFFVKLLNPKKRKLLKPKTYRQEGIHIQRIHIIDQIPKIPLPFRSIVELTVETEKKLTSNQFLTLKPLKKSAIMIKEKPNKRSEKFVYDLKYKRLSSNSFILFLNVDGGLPIKRFVEGNNVSPNLSTLLNNQCTCKTFDFHQVSIIH